MYEPLIYGVLALTGLSITRRVVRTAFRYYTPKRRGILGERRVNHILRTVGFRGKSRLHNLLLPSEHGTSQIDHVLVTQHGLFIIETKNLRGDISRATQGSQWIQRTPSGKVRTFLDPTLQNNLHVRAVTNLLQQDYPQLRCYSIVAFSDAANLIIPVPNVVNFRNLRLAIKTRCTAAPIFSKAEVRAISKQLRQHNIKSFRKRRLHKIRANLAAAAAKNQSRESLAALYEEARNTPITYLGQPLDTGQTQRSREAIQLTDAGSFLRIGNRTGSIEDFLESAKRDAHGLPVARGAACDHFICPYTGDRFPFSEFKSFYHGLWAAYLTQNPQLVSYMRKEGFENLRTGVYRNDQVLKEYLTDPDSFISSAKETVWYQNMAQKLTKPKAQSLNTKLANANKEKTRRSSYSTQKEVNPPHKHECERSC